MLSSIGCLINVEGRKEEEFVASGQPILLEYIGRSFDSYMREQQVKRLEEKSTEKYIG
jgi:hypothetical protein